MFKIEHESVISTSILYDPLYTLDIEFYEEKKEKHFLLHYLFKTCRNVFKIIYD